MKVVDNISYAEAVKKVQEQRRSDDTDKDKDISRQEVGQAVENNPTLTVDGLILFIAYVINCTDQVRHKTEKM